MSLSVSEILIITTMSMCSQNNESSEPTPFGFTCEDYDIMINVELRLARSCSTVDDCQQVLFAGDLACEPNSIVGHVDFNSNYLYELMDEAIQTGCPVELPIPQDCSDTALACVNDMCTWQ